MNTLKHLANKLVLCAIGSVDKQSSPRCSAGDREKNTIDKRLTVVRHYLTEEVELVGEAANDNKLVNYEDYRENVDIYLAVVRAIIAAVHVKAHTQPQFALLFLTSVEKHGLSPPEKETLNREFKHPVPIQAIVRLVQTSQIAALVYTLSLLTLDRYDISAEDYLRELAGGLDLAEVSEGVELTRALG